MRLLFVKEALSWPRSSGHDVHCFFMMRALARLGHDVSLITGARPAPEAIEGLRLASQRTFSAANGALENGYKLRLTPLQERFRSYWGIESSRIKAVGALADEIQADAVVAVGLPVLPYLGNVVNACRVWYAADEWAWHHLSLVRLTDRSTWQHIKLAAVKGMYERAYGSLVDRVWVVSEGDRRAMRVVAGVHDVDLLPNGVDGDQFCPQPGPEQPRSCVFWGRLDFEPNIQALQWFCRRIWPALRREAPDARFTIYGFKPTPEVASLVGRDGISLIADLPDIRSEIGRHQVVVLPFVSGGGIKNKLLEAAALGKAIVCTPRACGGLRTGVPPLVTAKGAGEWVKRMLALWAHAEERRNLGAKARSWVLTHHTWDAAALTAEAGIRSSLRRAARR